MFHDLGRSWKRQLFLPRMDQIAGCMGAALHSPQVEASAKRLQRAAVTHGQTARLAGPFKAPHARQARVHPKRWGNLTRAPELDQQPCTAQAS